MTINYTPTIEFDNEEMKIINNFCNLMINIKQETATDTKSEIFQDAHELEKLTYEFLDKYYFYSE